MIKLIIYEPEGEIREFDLEPGIYSLGRSKENDIVVNDRFASRKHARILFNPEDDTFTIEDLKSRHGVYVNKTKILEKGNLDRGNEIRIGQTKIEITSLTEDEDATTILKENEIDQRFEGLELNISEPTGEVRKFDLAPGLYYLGRSEENDIVLNDKTVSRKHAGILFNPEDGTFTIEDLKSRHGVYVNKTKILEKGKLDKGDEIRIGQTKIEITSLAEDEDATIILKEKEIDQRFERSKLIIYEPTGQIRKIDLEPGTYGLGRDKKNEIILNDKVASRKHARILFHPEDGTFIIEDLKSRHGVFVNKTKIREKKELNEGDEIRIGGTAIEVMSSFEAEMIALPDSSMIVLEKVTKVYKLGKVEVKALRGIDLEIKEGEFLSICGPSGSGKSTLLNLIGCIDTPTSGKVSILGKNVSDFNDASLSKMRNTTIGFIFQSFNLIPVLTALENVEYPLVVLGVSRGERLSRAAGILSEVGLAEFSKHRPEELSGGQRQRVAIARALVTKPKMVLADEPTANLDSVTSIEILDLMKKMNEEHKTTFIFSTHDPKIMQYAKKIYNLVDGGLIEDSAFSTS